MSETWIQIAETDGWGPITGLAEAAIEGIAWHLIDATMDTADREPGPYTISAARLSARKMIAGERITQSVHTWGFFDGNGAPRLPDGIALSDLTPFENYERLTRHFAHFGTEIVRQNTTRTLDGWFVGAEIQTDSREGCAAMWHTIARPRDEWPDFPDVALPPDSAATS